MGNIVLQRLSDHLAVTYLVAGFNRKHTADRVLAQNKKTYTRTEMQTISYEDVEKAVRQLEYAERIQNACEISKAVGFIAS